MEKPEALIPAFPAPILIKHLASCNKSTRDRALRLLMTWLPSQKEIPDEDLKKLWKGLFYCVWHADKTLVVGELINSLSSLVLTLHLPLSLQYFSVFMLTMRREWSGIDAHSIDKFYLLIRRFLNYFFQLIKKNNWDLDFTRKMIGILEKTTFFASDNLLGNGVNYHIASIFLEEFKQFLPVRVEILDILFKCFFNVMGKCQDKVLIAKIERYVFDVLLGMGKGLLMKKKLGDTVDDEMLACGTIALTMGFSAWFYELGSSPDCFQGNRKVLFGLHQEFLKLEKDLEMSGIEISLPVVEVDEDEDVPKLIPIVSSKTKVKDSTSELVPVAFDETEVSTSISKSSKKKKASDDTEVSTSISKSSKKKKKVKKGLDGSNKKTKMKKNGGSVVNEDAVIVNGSDSVNEPTNKVNVIDFNESVISNLQMQFEKVAAEVGLDKDGSNSFNSPTISVKHTIPKKRKRARSVDGQKSQNTDLSGLEVVQGDAAAKTNEKSAKKVRFSMKNNLVWKPHSPMPPQDLRLPPSVTPRGSALKKGLSPGPIREMPPATKKVKRKKKGPKGIKPIAPAIKRLRKLKALSI